jgi:Mg/Co/Ni transporter MgtE
MKPLPSELKLPESRLKNAGILIKRFSAGAVIGLVITAIYWGYAQSWHPQSLARGIAVSLILVIIFGGLTTKWGYKFLQALWESMNLP